MMKKERDKSIQTDFKIFTEESKGCNYYLPDLKSDCNNGVKRL
jgi:hypothetical protein